MTALSFSTKGALDSTKAKKPSTISTAPTSTMALPQPQVGPSSVSAPKLGSNSGMIKTNPQPSIYGEAAKPTIQKDVSGNTYQAPKSNPSVLAQQQALNKLGAGLVEDGISGPKTREAIAKYGSSSTSGAVSNNQTSTKSNTGTTPGAIDTPKPMALDTQSNAERLINAGQTSPEYLAQQAEANRIAEERKKLVQEFAQKEQNINRTAGFLTQASGLQGQLQSQYNQVNSALSGQEASAASRLANANTAQGMRIGTANTVFGAGLVSPTTQGQAEFSGLSGYQGGSDQFGNANDPASGVNVQSYKDLYSKYNQGKASLAQAQGIENKIANTLMTNPDINNQPVSFLTNLNQFVSGQLGTAPQQLLAQQVNNYIQTLGIDPASAVSIATQQKGTLKQLLQNLKETATNNNEALKTTADGLNKSPSGSTGDTTSAGGYKFKLVNGKWVPA